MTLSMFQAAVPPCLQMMGALGGVLGKAAAHCEAHKINPAVLLGCRLFPNMLALTWQVQTASDFARGGCARLAGVEAPKFDDTETTFAELQARLDRSAEFISSLKPDQIDGSEEREIVLKVVGNQMRFRGQPYLVNFMLPNLYFHATTAYDILRHNGVEIGKRDFIGSVPGLG